MPKYKQRKDGRYATTFHGKPVYAKSSKELEDKINELNYFYNTGKIINNDKLTFKDWSEKWFSINMAIKETGTKNEIKYLLNKHIYPTIGFIKVKDIKPFHIKDLIKNMQSKGICVTANKTLSLIKRILQEAVENDIVAKNAASGIKKIHTEKEPKNPLTLKEDEIFIQTANKIDTGCFFMLLRYCGLRREEIVALEKADVDLVNKKLNISKAVHFNHNQPNLKSTKNKKSRKVDIPNILIPFLEKQLQTESKYLFTKKTNPNEMLSESSTKRWLESFIYNCNLISDTKMTFTYHQLRHSYCTMLYYADIKIKKAQELMGHSSADMVYDIYTHLDEERENSEQLINDYIDRIIVKK